jgi:hypothetical protein
VNRKERKERKERRGKTRKSLKDFVSPVVLMSKKLDFWN